MKFVIPQEDFSKTLNIGAKSLLSRANLPILSSILITVSKNKLEVLSTDLDSATRVVISAKVDAEGRVALVGRNLIEFVSQLPEGDITFEKLGEEGIISTKGHNARFVTMDAEDFPAIPKIEKGFEVGVGGVEFVDAVNKVAFSASQDEGRPVLTGVLFELNKSKLSMVATDGYRLSFCEMEVSGEIPTAVRAIVPARAVVEVGKIVSEVGGEENQKIKIIISDNFKQINFVVGSVEFTSRLIEGEFPNYSKIIPTSFETKVKLNKSEFTKIVRLASIFSRESGSIVKLSFLGASGKKVGQAVVSALGAQVGSSESEMEAEVNGKGGEIAFNFRYLLEALAIIEGEEIYFEMIESLNPGRLTSSDDSKFFHIIMPVRLQN